MLEAALAGGAGVIVSGDDDLLSLGTVEGVQIVTIPPFLAMLDGLAH